MKEVEGPLRGCFGGDARGAAQGAKPHNRPHLAARRAGVPNFAGGRNAAPEGRYNLAMISLKAKPALAGRQTQTIACFKTNLLVQRAANISNHLLAIERTRIHGATRTPRKHTNLRRTAKPPRPKGEQTQAMALSFDLPRAAQASQTSPDGEMLRPKGGKPKQ